MGVENDIFLSEVGSGLGETGGTPPTRIFRSTPHTPGLVSPIQYSVFQRIDVSLLPNVFGTPLYIHSWGNCINHGWSDSPVCHWNYFLFWEARCREHAFSLHGQET